MGATLRRQLSWWGQARYLGWRLAGRRSPLCCRLKTGEWVRLRPPPSSDLDTANEVFATTAYDPPRGWQPGPGEVVDLGSNVGYTLLRWARALPAARITGFEPHPRHAELAREHLRRNGLEGRVTLVEAAVGTAAGTAVLTDAESGSSLVPGADGGQQGMSVRVVDVFETLLSRPVGLLKMDIEGSEYPILEDARFGQVRAGLILLEWHALQGRGHGPDWCERRLREAGYEVEHGWRFADFGLMWAAPRWGINA